MHGKRPTMHAHLDAMQVCAVNPTRWRDGDAMVREVYEYVDQVPVAQVEGIAVGTPVCQCILMIAVRHVMADKDSRGSKREIIL